MQRCRLSISNAVHYAQRLRSRSLSFPAYVGMGIPARSAQNSDNSKLTIMKKTIFALIVLASLSVAAETTITLRLPESGLATTILNGETEQDKIQAVQVGGTWNNLLATFAGKEYGIYAGPQTSNVYLKETDSNPWGNLGEGTWTLNSNNTGTITLLGRSGVGGDACVLVLGSEIAVGSQLSSFTFHAAGSSDNTLTSSITLGLAIVDNTGATLYAQGGTNFTANNATGASQTLSLDSPLTWADGYKVLAIIDGVSDNGKTKYTISDISVSAQLVPEPTTATLSLLALAGLAARRRRK